MRTTFSTLATMCLGLVAAQRTYMNEYKVLPGHKKPEHVISPQPFHTMEQLPKNFDWGDVGGLSYLTPNRNQHIPIYCGSCWAHGAISALEDRIKIARKAASPDIKLSIQMILNCGTDIAGSCHGGSHTGTYEFIMGLGSDGLPYETCQNYEAVDHECTPMNICKTCWGFHEDCEAVHSYPNVTITEYGVVKGEQKIMSEIYTRGPVACGIDAEKNLHDYTGGIIHDTEGNVDIDHIISLVGWGEDDDGTKYWIGRNSWGEYWGEGGFFRIVRGINNLAIEETCAWAVPDTWVEPYLTANRPK